MHKSLSGIGFSDHIGSSRGAVEKFSSMSSSAATAGGGGSLQFSHLMTVKYSWESTGLHFWVDGKMGIIGFW